MSREFEFINLGPYDFSIDERQAEIYTRRVIIEKYDGKYMIPSDFFIKPVDLTISDFLSFGC